MQKYSDAELVALYLESRGSQYLTELFTRHGNIVYRTALRVMKNPSDAEDIMQTVYCKMITSLHLYKGTGSVIGWMLQIVIHTCYNQRQSEKSRINRDKKIMSERVQTVSPKNDDLKEIMETHLNKLPEIYKVPITLQIMEGLSIKEVSEALEIPEKTIRSQIARGLEKLKISLQNVGITASVMMIGDSLKQVPMPMAPASINSSTYFQSIIKSKAAASTKLAVATSSKSYVLAKILSVMIIAGISIATYLNLPLSNKVGSLKKIQEWNFENISTLEEYQNIGVVKGGISIEEGRGVGSSKGLKIAENTIVEIDISQYQLPITISYDLDVFAKESMTNQILFDDKSGDINKKLPFYSGLRESLDIKPNQSINKNLGFTGNWYVQFTYLDENSYDCWVNDKRSHLLLNASIGNKKIYLSFKGQALVDNFKIESIEKNKLPDKSIFEKIASGYSFKDETESYPIDKTKLGYEKNSNVKPQLKFISTALKVNTPIHSNVVIYPRIAENGKVEWSIKRSVLKHNWSFENNNELEPHQAIELLKGDIQIVEKIGINDSKALQFNEESIVALNISEYQLPIKVSYKFDFSKEALRATQRMFFGSYLKNKELKDLSELRERITVDIDKVEQNKTHGYSGNWFTHEFYIDEMGVDFWNNGSRSHMLIGQSISTSKIFLYIGGKSKIDDLEIRSVKANEMPDRAVCEKIASEIKLTEGVKEYEIDKVALGLKANSSATPNISFRSAHFFAENFDLIKPTTMPRLSVSNQVEWVKNRRKISKKWEFETFREVLDFKLVSGSIFFEKNRGENNSNCLAVDKSTIFAIDISEYQLPLKINLKFDIVLAANTTDSGIVLIKSALVPEKNIFNFRNLSNTKSFDVSKGNKSNANQNVKVGFIGQWLTRTIYVSEDCIDVWFDGKRSGLTYQTSLDNKKLYFLNFDQTIIDNLTIETIEVNQLPQYNEFKNYVATVPFQKGMRSFFPENKVLNLEMNSKPEVNIYDYSFLEESLGLQKNKTVGVMMDNEKILKNANSIFPAN